MRNAFYSFAFVTVLTSGLVGCAASAEGVSGAEGIEAEEVALSTAELSALPNLAGGFRRAEGSVGGPSSVAFKYATKSATKGTYFIDTGIRCITEPCPSTDEGTFKVSKRACGTGYQVELKGRLGDGRASRQTFTIDATPEGSLLLAGIEANDGARLVAQAACVITGCGGSVCANGPVMTICRYEPQQACYAPNSICARNAGGECGWAPTAALSTCLENLAQD